MSNLIEIFERSAPEIVFEWTDKETEAKGWVVINSLRGGAAGGGTRMRKGLNRDEVQSLAKTMEIKFTVSGPQIGGAKSGINFDPEDPRKQGVLERWYKAILPLLKSYYGTGGDLNVDELHEVIPITKSFGLAHPQEGVVNGYFNIERGENQQKIERLQYGVSKIVTDNKYIPSGIVHYKVADLITGYGVAEAIKHYYTIWGGTIKGKRAIIQGWGNVGAAAGFYLSKYGVSIVGILNRNGGFVKTEGYNLEEIQQLLFKKANLESELCFLPYEEVMQKIWSVGAEIFIPAAGSRMVEKSQLDTLIQNGLEVVSCGANVPFNDKEIFMGPILSEIDSKVSIIPDFIANCGMARVFSYLMENEGEITDEILFEDTSSIIKQALLKTFELSQNGLHLTENSLHLAIQKLQNKDEKLIPIF
ncbi:Glu/Leu/Phe/Val dehydrogenase dimerization domain-containing protein [Flavobacterium cellulosilyticum]|uniref:Amino acid dehydrogenase n=1 Tax=Flavobacterium cellulosilyticum TaxID=2541731 RepID=A0A4R5CCX6_9FLAO|nr:Glu/Leu/Phe/Val dehydrogenase dimerization domain-containing protein [Flavobacterium cellulosilyticum]TDD97315.1 amino acid dehydrogenase [Flavobacterium cellulosilyticum]